MEKFRFSKLNFPRSCNLKIGFLKTDNLVFKSGFSVFKNRVFYSMAKEFFMFLKTKFFRM